MKPAYGEWRRKRVSASCILSYYRIRPPPQRFHTLQAHFSHELHFINLTREILSCISLMWCDILALQVRYNIRSFHTRSVYHLHSRYHADTYITRYGGERISLKKSTCRNKCLSWWSIADSNRWHPHCQCGTLPTELMPQARAIITYVGFVVK